MSWNTAGFRVYFNSLCTVSNCTDVVISIVSFAEPMSIILEGICAPENTTTWMSQSYTIGDYHLTFVLEAL